MARLTAIMIAIPLKRNRWYHRYRIPFVCAQQAMCFVYG